jgi:hypothetical protein
MEGSELNVVEQNTARSHQFLLFGELLFFFEAVLDFEDPFLASAGSFKNVDNRADCYVEYHHPFVAELIHGPAN